MKTWGIRLGKLWLAHLGPSCTFIATSALQETSQGERSSSKNVQPLREHATGYICPCSYAFFWFGKCTTFCIYCGERTEYIFFSEYFCVLKCLYIDPRTCWKPYKSSTPHPPISVWWAGLTLCCKVPLAPSSLWCHYWEFAMVEALMLWLQVLLFGRIQRGFFSSFMPLRYNFVPFIAQLLLDPDYAWALSMFDAGLLYNLW